MTALLVLKLTVLLVASLALARLLRQGPAVARHRFWSGVFVALLALPLLTFSLPGVDIPVPARWMESASSSSNEPMPQAPATIGTPTADRHATSHATGPSAATQVSASQQSTSFTFLPGLRIALLAVWAIGTGAALAMLLLSLARVHLLSQDCEEVSDPAWQTAAASIGARLGLARPVRLLLNSAITTPMAGGVIRPSIYLPDSSPRWSSEQRDIVLAHEIVHLVRQDPLRHVLTRLTLACYWFHPLAWLAARQAEIAREDACDEAVLSLGTRRSTYARVLLDFADAISPRGPALGALPIVQKTMLEKRLVTILNDTAQPAARRRTLFPVMMVMALTLIAATVQPGAAPVSTAVVHGSATSQDAAPGQPRLPDERVPVWAPSGREIRLEGAITVEGAQLALGAGCSSTRWNDQSFNGSLTIAESGDGVREMTGWRGNDRIVQKTFDTLRICMLAEDVGDRNSTDHPSQWIDDARRIVLATERGRNTVQLEIVRERGGSQRATWLVNGAIRPVDKSFDEWRRQALAVLDTTWEVSALHGRVSSLRGEISSIRGERSSLLGEISSLRGEMSSMHGEISSVRGHESSLRGEISSIRGHLSSLHGAISSENGAISSLHASRYGADAAERNRIAARVAEHDKEIARLEQEIRAYDADARVAAVEKEIAAYAADRKVAEIDARIKAFDVEAKVAAVERRIAALDVDRRIAAIEREIEALDASRRVAQLEDRRRQELKRLEAAITAIR